MGIVFGIRFDKWCISVVHLPVQERLLEWEIWEKQNLCQVFGNAVCSSKSRELCYALYNLAEEGKLLLKIIRKIMGHYLIY